MDVLATAILAVFLLGLSLLVLSGRGSVFVAGFNTAAPSQRARCDERGLCRGMGGLTFGCAVGLALMAFGLYIDGALTLGPKSAVEARVDTTRCVTLHEIPESCVLSC